MKEEVRIQKEGVVFTGRVESQLTLRRVSVSHCSVSTHVKALFMHCQVSVFPFPPRRGVNPSRCSCKTPENSNFLKNRKIKISIKNPEFF